MNPVCFQLARLESRSSSFVLSILFSQRVTIEYVYLHAPSCAMFVLQHLISLPLPASRFLFRKRHALQDLLQTVPAWCLSPSTTCSADPAAAALNIALKSPHPEEGPSSFVSQRKELTRRSISVCYSEAPCDVPATSEQFSVEEFV